LLLLIGKLAMSDNLYGTIEVVASLILRPVAAVVVALVRRTTISAAMRND
jgi:hypothetical protein